MLLTLIPQGPTTWAKGNMGQFSRGTTLISKHSKKEIP